MAQHTINLPCIADTYCDDNNEYTNYGSETELKVGQYYSNDPYTTKNKFALLKFDGGSLPLRKKIVNSKLRLFVTNKFVDHGASVKSAHENDFEEYTATAENYFVHSYGQTRELGGVLTGQYQEFNFDTIIELPYTYQVSLFATGSPPLNPYIFFSSRETANPPLLVVTYEDVTPSKPTLNEPIGSYEINSNIIRLSWNYISSVGGAQESFDLQWSSDQITWTTISQTTAVTFYDVPADTLPSGNIYWRVQTYNEYDEASGYSDIAAFYAIGAPENPLIQSVENKAKPIITWSATNQQVYQVQILQGETILHDSGILPGIITRSYKVPLNLPNGSYQARVRIKNEYDLYSEWGSTGFEINLILPAKPTLNIQKTIFGFELNILNAANKVLIYRNENGSFICIGSTTVGWYFDYAVASGVEYEYYARSINTTTEAFTDSDIVSMAASLKNNLFAPVSNLSNIIRLKFNINNIPGKTFNLNPLSVTTFFSGRTYAVTEFSEHEESAISFSFFLRDHGTVEQFKTLIRKKETVLFRDARGRKIYGTLGGWSEVDDRKGYQIGFVLAEANYNEEVEG